MPDIMSELKERALGVLASGVIGGYNKAFMEACIQLAAVTACKVNNIPFENTDALAKELNWVVDEKIKDFKNLKGGVQS